MLPGGKRTWHFLEEDGSVGTPEGKISDLNALGFDVLYRRYAMLALGNLLIFAAPHSRILEAGFMPVALGCLESEDPETRFYTAYALNKLAANDANLEVGAGMVEGL
jgi:hypothetical protein